MNKFIIRLATNEDVHLIADFEEEARISEPDIWIDKFDKENYIEALSQHNLELTDNKIIIALIDEKIVARCDCLINKSLFDFGKTGYVDWIYTLKDYRGQGIAKKMILYCDEYFRSNNVDNYYLFTASNVEAKIFYEKLEGFTYTLKEVGEKSLKK